MQKESTSVLTPPSPTEYQGLVELMRPLKMYHRPVWMNTHRLDGDQPTMFILNHTLFGYEFYLLVTEMYRKWRFIIRGLGHKDFFGLPGWENLVGRWGIVPGTQENGDILMSRGEPIGVTPGGNNEAAKSKGQKYELLWGKRAGFARLAIRHKYRIIPIACIGPDDCFDIVANPEEIKESPLYKLMEASGLINLLPGGGKLVFPLATGIGGFTPFPKPERFYFSFGEPIDCSIYKGEVSDDAAWEVRKKTETLLHKEIRETLRFRAKEQEKRPFKLF